MRPVQILAAAAVVASASLVLTAGRAVVQVATPTTTPDAVTCSVEPRSTEEVLALWFGPDGVPVGTPGSGGPAVPEAALPVGSPADAETIAAVDAVGREFYACFEANQNTRAFTLMTDDLIRLFVPYDDTLEQTRATLEAYRTLPVAEPLALPPLRDVRMLEDGRVGAILVDEAGSLFLVFERLGDRWLVDGFEEVGSAGPPVAVAV